MKSIKTTLLLFAMLFTATTAFSQANAYINIITQNSGIVPLGGTVNIEVTVGNTGPVSPIGVNKVRAQVAVPAAIVGILASGQQTGIPAGWSILSNSGTSITVCNGSDVIGVGESRTILIKVQGNVVGGPSTVVGQLSFGPGTAVCTGPGSLPGDNSADNSSTTTIQVIPACALTVSGTAGSILCNGATTTITATVANATGTVEYSITGGAPFQLSNTFIAPAGSYTITAREVNNTNCIATSNQVVITEPGPMPAPTVNIVQPDCMVPTGTVTITSTTSGFTFSLDGSAYASYPSPGYNLATGSHTLRAKDGNGCISAVTNFTVDAQPPSPPVPTVNVVHPTCSIATGTITLTSSSTGLTFSLDGSPFVAYPAGGYTVAAGSHTLTANNSFGCSSTTLNITMNVQPPTPVAPTVSVTQPTCTTATGTITISSSTSGLTLSLDGGSYITYPAGGFIVNPGSHTLSAQNSNGCISGTINITIDNQPPTPSIPIPGTITQPTCVISSGTVELSGLPAGSWVINPGNIAGTGSSVIVGNLAAATYNFTVTNSAGCTSLPTGNIVIDPVPGAPNAPTVNVVQPTCTVATGTISIASSTSGLTFSLDGGPYTSYPAGGYTVSAGMHTLEAQNSASCFSPVTNITVDAQPLTPGVPTVNVAQPTCSVATATITISSTITGLQFSLDGAAFANYPVGGYIVLPGSHTLAAINSNSCVSSVTNVVVNMQPVTPSAPAPGAITQPSCSVSTGSVVLNNLPPGNWMINPGSISGTGPSYTVNNLAPGTYNFTVTNSGGCTSSLSAQVFIDGSLGPAAAPAVNVTQPTCTIATGIISITSSTTGFTFSLDGGTFAAYPPGGYVVAAGAHTLIAKNNGGCISPVTNVTVNAQPPTPTAPTTSVVQPTCTVATGIITITSSTTGLDFSIDGAVYAPYPAGGYVVSPGSHTLTAKNSSGCISSITNITVNAQPVTPNAPTVNVVDPTCTVSTGSILITSSTTGLIFSLDGSAFSSYPVSGYTVSAGPHTLVAQSSGGCTSTITNITVNSQPLPPAASLTSGTINCFGGTTTITVTASGGTAPYEYSLNGGSYQSSNNFIVGAGIYNIIVRGANSCTAATPTLTITQPVALTIASNASQISCHGGTTNIIVAAAGGTAPYEYSLNGGPFQSSNNFSAGPGSYNVMVRDANNCTVQSSNILITDPAQLTAAVSAPRITRCGGTSHVFVNATGGRTPYSGTGTFVRGPGTWTFRVTDVSGCTSDATIEIEPPGCMNLHVFPNPSNSIITIDHSVAKAGARLQVFDVSGRLLLWKEVAANSFQNTLDIRKLAAACYVLVFVNGEDKKQVLVIKN